jgi:TonB family protein
MTGSPKQSALYSIAIHAGAIALVLFLTTGKNPPLKGILPAAIADLKVYLPQTHGAAGRTGGGGGLHDPAPASRGSLPRRAPRMFVAPAIRVINADPKLAMEQTLLVNAPVVSIQSPQIGDPNGVIGPFSPGPGKGGGIGGKDGAGIGPDAGDGVGRGPGGPDLGGFNRGGGSLTAPVALYRPEPPYTEEARRAKLQGTVMLMIDIDIHGQAQNIRVVRSLGLGLDERAVEAVRTWRFKPAYRDGKPVMTTATIEVNFRLL